MYSFTFTYFRIWKKAAAQCMCMIFFSLFLFLTAIFLSLFFTSLAFSLNPVSYSRSHHHTFNFLFNTKQRHIKETLRYSNSEYIHELSLSYIYIYMYTLWSIWFGMGDLIFIAIAIIVITLFCPWIGHHIGNNALHRTSYIRMTRWTLTNN